jgi:hypothetical protein
MGRHSEGGAGLIPSDHSRTDSVFTEDLFREALLIFDLFELA